MDIAKYDTIFADHVPSPPQIIDLPENFQTLTGAKTRVKQRALNYLYHRGFTDRDILTWKVGFCDFGEYQDRIIIPSFDNNGNVNFFVGRSYTDDWMKYKNPQVSKDIIFNDLNIDWDDDIVLVEGAFDAMKCETLFHYWGRLLEKDLDCSKRSVKENPISISLLMKMLKEKNFQ